ncbi:MAG: hypothetical protein JW682_02440 [Campylobacterales bacterium]|nr:hypothetical protein [Campylobacterales bacterium]HEO99637.1 hypothetical protein [Campylobacterota bacterium]
MIHETVERPLNCFYYYKFSYLYQYPVDYAIYDEEFKDIAFNTKEMQKAHNEYNHALSGTLLTIGEIHPDQCNFDIDAVIEEAKQ